MNEGEYFRSGASAAQSKQSYLDQPAGISSTACSDRPVSGCPTTDTLRSIVADSICTLNQVMEKMTFELDRLYGSSPSELRKPMQPGSDSLVDFIYALRELTLQVEAQSNRF